MKHWVRVQQALLLSLVLLTAWMLPLFRWDGAVFSASAVSTIVVVLSADGLYVMVTEGVALLDAQTAYNVRTY